MGIVGGMTPEAREVVVLEALAVTGTSYSKRGPEIIEMRTEGLIAVCGITFSQPIQWIFAKAFMQLSCNIMLKATLR
jgi:hypothetical protein